MAFINPRNHRVYLRMSRAPICQLMTSEDSKSCSICPIRRIAADHGVSDRLCVTIAHRVSHDNGILSCGDIADMYSADVAKAFGYVDNSVEVSD